MESTLRIQDFDAVIWDWNGTIMNDIDIALDAINVVLKKYNRSTVDLERYLEIFRFPVKDYYRDLGFDFSDVSFESVGKEFIDEYESLWKSTTLQKGITDVLHFFQAHNKSQCVLSAAAQESLLRWISHFRVGHFFHDVIGLDNIYAAGKLQIGKELVARAKLVPSRTVLIGDTSHDAEVAAGLGCHCVLLAHGHESAERLQQTGFPVVRGPQELLSWVKPQISSIERF